MARSSVTFLPAPALLQGCFTPPASVVLSLATAQETGEGGVEPQDTRSIPVPGTRGIPACNHPEGMDSVSVILELVFRG